MCQHSGSYVRDRGSRFWWAKIWLIDNFLSRVNCLALRMFLMPIRVTQDLICAVKCLRTWYFLTYWCMANCAWSNEKAQVVAMPGKVWAFYEFQFIFEAIFSYFLMKCPWFICRQPVMIFPQLMIRWSSVMEVIGSAAFYCHSIQTTYRRFWTTATYLQNMIFPCTRILMPASWVHLLSATIGCEPPFCIAQLAAIWNIWRRNTVLGEFWYQV